MWVLLLIVFCFLHFQKLKWRMFQETAVCLIESFLNGTSEPVLILIPVVYLCVFEILIASSFFPIKKLKRTVTASSNFYKFQCELNYPSFVF